MQASPRIGVNVQRGTSFERAAIDVDDAVVESHWPGKFIDPGHAWTLIEVTDVTGIDRDTLAGVELEKV